MCFPLQQIKIGFSKGLDTSLNDYQQEGFKEAWDSIQKHVGTGSSLLSGTIRVCAAGRGMEF